MPGGDWRQDGRIVGAVWAVLLRLFDSETGLFETDGPPADTSSRSMIRGTGSIVATDTRTPK